MSATLAGTTIEDITTMTDECVNCGGIFDVEEMWSNFHGNWCPPCSAFTTSPRLSIIDRQPLPLMNEYEFEGVRASNAS